MNYEPAMRRAIEAAREGVLRGQSPFGAAIADVGGRIVTCAHNTVRRDTDCTAHAEINCLRAACRELGRIDLGGHVMASTCEPCPMCAAAIHWARLDAVAIGATIADAANAGFNEMRLSIGDVYRQGESRVRVVTGVLEPECRALFDEWRRGSCPQAY